MPANQTSLFETETEVPVINEESDRHIEYDRKAFKKHPGRNELPKYLPLEDVIIEPTEDISGMKRIDEEITETLEYTPASLVRKSTVLWRRRDVTPLRDPTICKFSRRPLPPEVPIA